MSFEIYDNPIRIEYVAGSGQTLFQIPFEFFDDADLDVWLTPVGSDYDSTNDLLSLSTDYTVTGAGVTGGGILALSTGATAGDIIRVYRNIPIERTIEYQNTGELNSELLNNDIDRAIAMIQQVNEVVDRAVVTDPVTGKIETDYRIGNVSPAHSDSLVTRSYVDSTVFSVVASDDIIANSIAVLVGIGGSFTNGGMFVCYGRDGLDDGGGGLLRYDASFDCAANKALMGVTAFDPAAASTSLATQQASTNTGALVRVQYDYITPQMAGAKADGTTDDTAAIQAAITATAVLGKKICHIPAGHYIFSKLYLHYDASANPLWPTGSTADQGRIRLQGDGQQSKGNFTFSSSAGTLLESNDATGPAIYCDGDPLSAGTNFTNGVQIHGMSIDATNSTFVVEFDRVTQYSGFEDVYINQGGTGGGIKWWNHWISYARNVRCEGNGSGVGFWINNESTNLSGGFYNLETVVCNNWATAIKVGETQGTTGARMHSVVMTNCQGGDSTTGMYFGSGAQQVILQGCHVEGNTLGIFIGDGANSITISESSSSSNDVGISIGDGTATGDNAARVRLVNWKSYGNASTTDHIKIQSDADIEDIYLENIRISGGGGVSENGIWLENANHNGVRLSGYSYATLANPTVNGNKMSLIDYGLNDVTETIASGAVTYYGGPQLRLRPESGTADDLDTINGGYSGAVVTVTTADLGDTITIKDGTGNIQLNATAGDFAMANRLDTITLMYHDAISFWQEIARSDNS